MFQAFSFDNLLENVIANKIHSLIVTYACTGALFHEEWIER